MAEAADQVQQESQAPQAVEVNEAVLPEAADSGVRGAGPIDLLLDATVVVEAQLGQVELPVRQVLQLGQGQVIKLDRQVGEPVDLLLRGVKFATGQLVVVGSQIGVRIKEILPNDE